MIVDSRLKAKFNMQKPYYGYIQEYLDQTLLNYASKKLFAYSSRIKALDSVSEKIEGGRFTCWNDIDDLVGCVLIIPNLSYEDEVLIFLQATFNEVETKKRGETFKSYDVFRFDSTRFIGTLHPDSEANRSEIHTIKFEIQIRSAFEHAWSVTTHDLAYKSETIDWRVLRLAAQLKSSVEQLDMITLGAKDASSKITKSKWPEIDIKIEMLTFLQKQFDTSIIPEDLKPKDFSRVVDNLFPLIKKKLNIWKAEKWKSELNSIFSKIEAKLLEMKKAGFPISLSLFQIIYGIFILEGFHATHKDSKTVFLKPEAFEVVFPELKDIEIREFRIE